MRKVRSRTLRVCPWHGAVDTFFSLLRRRGGRAAPCKPRVFNEGQRGNASPSPRSRSTVEAASGTIQCHMYTSLTLAVLDRVVNAFFLSRSLVPSATGL